MNRVKGEMGTSPVVFMGGLKGDENKFPGSSPPFKPVIRKGMTNEGYLFAYNQKVLDLLPIEHPYTIMDFSFLSNMVDILPYQRSIVG